MCKRFPVTVFIYTNSHVTSPYARTKNFTRKKTDTENELKSLLVEISRAIQNRLRCFCACIRCLCALVHKGSLRSHLCGCMRLLFCEQSGWWIMCSPTYQYKQYVFVELMVILYYCYKHYHIVTYIYYNDMFGLMIY